MKTYNLLSKITILKKYSVKFLFVAFLGIHIPLIGLIVYLIFSDLSTIDPYTILFFVLIMTLAATSVTLVILNSLLNPILITKNFVDNYIHKKELGKLPVHYKDEIGILMSDVNYAVNSLDDLINEKQDLIALMSHDLKNPLAAVMSYTEIIAADEKFKPIAEKILNAANAQKNIINSVLEMLEQENVIINEDKLTGVNIIELMRGITNRYTNKQNEKDIKLEFNMKSDNILAESNLISQVFENVYSNSLKFTEKGTIIIKAENTSNKMVKITVEDTGIGFDKEVGEKLFDRFTTYKRKGTKEEATTGLGLYLSRKIVTRHKGTITAHSEGKYKGSKFEIILPSANVR